MARRRTAQAPAYPYRVEPQFTAQLTWRFVDELAAYAKGPVLLKGIRTTEDVKLAIEHGAALPEIVDAVQSRIPVLMDGGAFGQVGVSRVLEMLQTELALAMGL